MNGASQQVGTLAGAGAITNSGTALATFSVAGPGATTFGGTISDGASQVALAVTGGALTLSGTGTYTGGTVVEGGELIVTNPSAIESGTNLAVGDPAELSLFGNVIPAQASGAAATAVPEPGTLALLAVVLAGAAACGLMRRTNVSR